MSCAPNINVWKDDAAFVISAELILLSTIAILGLTIGLTSVRDAVVSEISDVAGALQDFNQCYEFSALSGHSASSCGSGFSDAVDFCDEAEDVAGAADNCIVFSPNDGGTESVTEYENSDNTTDISGSQNDTTLKWELEPGQEADADAATQAILDCIAAGHAAQIEWTTADGNTFTFSADTVVSGGPEAFAFSGASGGTNGSGKITSVTVTCPDGGSGGSGDSGISDEN